MFAYASQAEAEAGTEDAKVMSPLRVEQAQTTRGLTNASQVEAEEPTFPATFSWGNMTQAGLLLVAICAAFRCARKSATDCREPWL